MTPQLLHDPLLRVALDALRDELKTQRLAEADDALEQREIVGAAVDLRREAAVDLDDVDRQPLEIRERRIARPEVVECELDAPLLQGLELQVGTLTARDEDALGQLERQQMRRQV